MLSIESIAIPVPRRWLLTSPYPWPAAGTLAMIAVAHLALLVLQARLTWGHPHYRFFPLVLLAAGLLAARDGSRLGMLVPGSDRRAMWVLGGPWAVLAGACLIGSAWMATVAAMLAALAVAYAVGGGRLVRPLLPAWGLLWLAIPPPLGLDYELVSLLQTEATHWSSRLLDVLGVFHLREGSVIRLTDRRLLIEEACSGIHSLFAVLSGTLFVVVWARRSPLRGLALVATAITWVFLGNVLRIVAVSYLTARWQLDLSTGWPHEALGLAVFALSLGLTASSDRLFSLVPCVLSLRRAWVEQTLMGWASVATAPRPAPAEQPVAPTQLPDLRRTRLASWPLAAAYGALILVQPLLIRSLLEDYFLPGQVVSSRLLTLRAGDLPASWGSLSQQGFRTIERDRGSDDGRFSQRWSYRWGARTVDVSLDGPFQGWHELTRCYAGYGWTVRERSVQPAGVRGAVAVVRLERPGERRGDLFFSLFGQRCQVLEPDNFGGRLGLLAELRSFWRRQSRQRTYQLQLFVEGTSTMTSAERGEATAFFRRIRDQLVERIGGDAMEVSG